jgi:hypothetical protein
MKRRLTPVQTGKVLDSLTKGEAQALSRAWDPQERSKGFHLYIKDSDVIKDVALNLAAREAKLRTKAKNQGVPFKPENPLNAYHSVRTGMWRELSAEKRAEWEALGKASKQRKDVLSEDRLVTFDLQYTKLMNGIECFSCLWCKRQWLEL